MSRDCSKKFKRAFSKTLDWKKGLGLIPLRQHKASDAEGENQHEPFKAQSQWPCHSSGG
jgi:hypothetical protein